MGMSDNRVTSQPHALADVDHSFLFVFVSLSAELLGESDEYPFRSTDVAEPIHVFILDYFTYKLRATLAEPFKRLVYIVHGEHDTKVTQGVDRSVAVIFDDRRREEAGELEAVMAVRCAHHSNLDTLIAQSSHTSSPFSFDHTPPFELKAQLEKEIDRHVQVCDDDSYVVHSFDCHVPNLQSIVLIYKVAPNLTTDAQVALTLKRTVTPLDSLVIENKIETGFS